MIERTSPVAYLWRARCKNTLSETVGRCFFLRSFVLPLFEMMTVIPRSHPVFHGLRPQAVVWLR